MNIRYLILIAFWCFLLPAEAQDHYKVMDWKTEATLRSYLIQSMHMQYDQRKAELSLATESDSALTEYRFKVKEKFLNILGELPGKTPLNAQITKRQLLDGYTLENVIFESRSRHHVTSNIYLPVGKGPFPAVLVFCGHEMTSKATRSYQETAILFVRNGFVVMVVDPVSQGERVQFTDSLGKRILRGSTTEHTLLNAGANLVGDNIVAWELYDNVRALDYLAGRSEVDAERIGCLGNSGGGAQTSYFIAFDERIKVAAPCSNIARRERNYELSGAGDGCQQIPFEGRELLEIGDFLVLFAPKPLLILAGRYDFVDYTGTVETFNELSGVYSVLKSAEKVALFTADDGHGISEPKRVAAAEWFTKWLLNKEVKITEPDIKVLEENDTWCTLTGQVNSFFEDEINVQEITLQAAHNLETSRKKFLDENNQHQVREKIIELLALHDEEFDVCPEVTATEKADGYTMNRVILRREGEVPLPCLFYMPDHCSRNDTVLILLNHSGKEIIASDKPRIKAIMEKGNPLFLADLRGMGETAELPSANEWKYYNREYHNAIISLHIGKPLPGQRVEDILTIIKYLSGETETGKLPYKIYATGAAAHSALYAAALSDRVTEVSASSTISTYFEILEKPMEQDWYSYVVPGVLNYFDLNDVIGKLNVNVVFRK